MIEGNPIGTAIALIAFFNIIVAVTMTATEMRRVLWREQNMVGKIFLAIIMSPAWALKIIGKCIIK